MHDNHYEAIRAGMVTSMQRWGWIEYAENVSAERRRWDIFWLALDRNYIRPNLLDELHKYLNDANINTALNRIYHQYFTSVDNGTRTVLKGESNAT